MKYKASKKEEIPYSENEKDFADGDEKKYVLGQDTVKNENLNLAKQDEYFPDNSENFL